MFSAFEKEEVIQSVFLRWDARRFTTHSAIGNG